MLVTLKHDADSRRVQAELRGLGLWPQPLTAASGQATALVIAPCSTQVEIAAIAALDGVAEVCTEPSAHPLLDASAGKPLRLGAIELGCGCAPVLMAGPCGVESPEQVGQAAHDAAQAGARLLRGGAFKPRTSPYSFSGHGRPALGWLRDAADRHGLGVVTEVMSEHEVDAVAEVADLMQVGSRNMQNYALLREVGRRRKPVLLKRGMAATIEEWLLSAEHLLAAGASGVAFCERGVHGFDPSTRNLLDLGAVALLAAVLQLPVVVDPSHAAGRRDLILPLARAALAAGAGGLLVETHPHPAEALSDGPQALDALQLSAVGQLVHPGGQE